MAKSIIKVIPRKSRTVEIRHEDITGAIDLITQKVIEKIKKKEETNVRK